MKVWYCEELNELIVASEKDAFFFKDEFGLFISVYSYKLAGMPLYRADDYGDSWCSQPIREAFDQYLKQDSE